MIITITITIITRERGREREREREREYMISQYIRIVIIRYEKMGFKTEFLQSRPTTERNKERQRKRERERERDIVHQLVRIPVYLRNQGGGG